MLRLRPLSLSMALALSAFSAPGMAAAKTISGVVETALQSRAAVRGEVSSAVAELRQPAFGLPLGGGLAMVEPVLRATVTVDRIGRLGSGRPVFQPRARHRLLAVEVLGRSEETRVSYPVSSTVFLGVGYSYVTLEDLAFEAAGTGSLESDYDSHNLLLRAHWQF